jgi:pimeloyl-ACP methyl ester carboxylesterase
MKKPLHLIYIPGILDNLYHIQSTAVRTWRLSGAHGHCHEMPWLGPESYEVKFQRLLGEIDKHAAKGHDVALIGASAGASAVLNAYVAQPDKIKGVVLLCAKVNYPETVSQKTYARNPAFKESLEQLQTNLTKLTVRQKERILSYYSPADGTIPYEGSIIPGVQDRRLPALKHGRAIIYGITFGAPGFIRYLKQWPNTL